MEVTTIDQLFHDVLEEIFSHLSVSDLKSCALVCKDWNQAIGSSAVTMKKLKTGFRLDRDHISIGCDLEGSREEIKIKISDQSYRQHQHLEVMIRDGSLAQLPSLDRFDVSQVKTLDLNLTSSWSIEFNKVMKLLSRMPLLQVLTINFYGYCTIGTSNALDFTKLRQLNVFSYDGPSINKIFDLIKADNVTEFTYHACAFARHSNTEIDAVVGFIKSKKSLSKLNVNTYVFTQMHRQHDFSGMNLESLIIDAGLNFSNFDDTLRDNIRESLISNAHSLTLLSFPSWLMSKEVLVVIFNCLTKLTKLDIVSAYDGDSSWIDNLSPNDIPHNLSLKTLKVERVGAIIGLKVILQRAPQLKKLTLGDVTGAIMNEVATSAPGLVELRINSLREVFTGDQRFDELKSLTIDGIGDADIQASMLAKCPKIEVFQCQYYRGGGLNSIIINILLQQNTLKYLRFTNFTPATLQIISGKLKDNYGNLRSLELRSADGKFLNFDFPSRVER